MANGRERESGTVRLEEAVAAFRAALEERTRARVPLDWAQTQNNLGYALWTLGEFEVGTGRLKEAVVAWELCLTVGQLAPSPTAIPLRSKWLRSRRHINKQWARDG
jgi:hypothetical protein